MDPMGHGQPSHSSYQRNWGHPYQRGPGHPHHWGPGNPNQMGSGHPHHWGPGNPNQMDPGHPYQRGSEDAYQMGLEDPYQRKLKQSFGRSKKIKKWASPNVVKEAKMLGVEVKKTNWFCTLCKMKFINQKRHDDHLSGSKHKKKIRPNKLLEQLQKTEPCFTQKKRIYLCHACNIGLKSPEDLELHFYSKEHIAKSELYRVGAVKSPPLRSNKTPCQYINPYLKAETCLSGRYSSTFWLNLIDKVYARLSPSNKQLFIEDMISQAHGCLHRGLHKKIVNLIMFKGGNQDERMVIQLREAYYKKNMTFNCNCGSNISQEELDEVRGITAKEVPLKVKRYIPDIVDPYLSDTTCEGGEKSSLFWLSKIEEVYRDLSNTKQKKFVLDMNSQAHACLHKDYHGAIIELLYGNLQYKHDSYFKTIDLLKIKYEMLNSKFVCTCETGMSQNVLQNEKAKESCADFNTTETKEELTYEDVLDILELDD